jgi:catechol 2,3-dioxygenase-like lactoylglutathione lyase family enzyme
MHHVALNVNHMQPCLDFYVGLLGMRIEWQPDENDVYLTSGTDNLALHRASQQPQGAQHLDHIGFIIGSPDEVDAWHDYLVDNGVEIVKAPRTHRDGARSFYCKDPDGNVVQMIFHPPLVTA